MVGRNNYDIIGEVRPGEKLHEVMIQRRVIKLHRIRQILCHFTSIFMVEY